MFFLFYFNFYKGAKWKTEICFRLLAACVVLVSSEEIDEYDYEDDVAPAPPQPPQQTSRGRLPLISSRQNKGPTLIGNANKISKQTGVGWNFFLLPSPDILLLFLWVVDVWKNF